MNDYRNSVVAEMMKNLNYVNMFNLSLKTSIALIALSESPSLPISVLMEKAGEANRSRFRTNILSPLIER